MRSEKECNSCKQIFPIEEFLDSKGKDRIGKCRPCRRKRQREIRKEIKLKVIEHYSNGKMCCNYCGYDNINALTIDHIDNNGAQDRRENKIGTGNRMQGWLFRHDYPEGYQILCANCNLIKLIDTYGKI